MHKWIINSSMSLISKIDATSINKQTTVNRSFWSQSTGQNEWMVLTTLAQYSHEN